MFGLDAIENLLPAFLQDVFKSDGNTTPRVLPAVNRFADWFSQSGLPFFKHYTDHSSEHSLDVFRSGIELIATSSLRLISARDIGYFLVATFCHDAGMHLTELHFQKLISPNHTTVYSTLDSANWPETWRSFLEEAKRFNSRKLESIFGDTKQVQELPTDTSDYTDRHRRLVGEFLRLNHPRLAHELGLGLDKQLGLGELLDGFSREEQDLIGLIARSHGAPVRAYFDYIVKRFDLRDYNRTHIVFLMAILRIADYIQLQAYRASTTKSAIHSIVSPISQREWRVHNSIKNITRTHDDPEAVYVDASPVSVVDFLRLENWLNDIQREIDVCWAVFGEVYGRQTDNGLSELKLCLRRVRSSIFERQNLFPYLPENIHFRVAEAEMLSLLLSPLYGNNPGYGVRELLQNAVDAVQEGLYLNKKECVEGGFSVVARIDFYENGGKFIIEDQGVGMTAATLKNYFLNAGASFRSSAAWRNKFLQEDGSTAITRTGRFGIGALASFMIGETIEVSTRYYASQPSDGLYFKASLHDPHVEVRRAELPAGTKIEIVFGKDKVGDFKHFIANADRLFAFPEKLNVKLSFNENASSQTLTLTSDYKFAYEENNIANYLQIKVASSTTQIPDFVNGIAIAPLNKHAGLSKVSRLALPITPPAAIMEASDGFSNKPYTLHIVDREAAAPINLARVAFTSTDDDINRLLEDKAYGEILESVGPLFSKSAKRARSTFFKASTVGFLRHKHGVCLCDAYVMEAANIRSLVKLYGDHSDLNELIQTLPQAAFSTGSTTQYVSTKTSLVYHLRHLNFVSRLCTSVLAIVRLPLFKALLSASYVPKWLERLGDTSRIIAIDEVEYVLIRWGSPQLEIEDTFLQICTKSKASHVEFFVCSDWTRSNTWDGKFAPQTGSSKRWIKDFSKSGCLMTLEPTKSDSSL